MKTGDIILLWEVYKMNHGKKVDHTELTKQRDFEKD